MLVVRICSPMCKCMSFRIFAYGLMQPSWIRYRNSFCLDPQPTIQSSEVHKKKANNPNIYPATRNLEHWHNQFSITLRATKRQVVRDPSRETWKLEYQSIYKCQPEKQSNIKQQAKSQEEFSQEIYRSKPDDLGLKSNMNIANQILLNTNKSSSKQ